MAVFPQPHIADFEYDNTRKFSIKTKVTEKLWNMLDDYSKKTERPKTWIIKKALIKYLMEKK